MLFNVKSVLVAGLISSSMLLSGCGDGIKFAPVQGTVTLDGKPLDNILVEFWPENGPKSFAETDSQGRFALKTEDGVKDGAAVGSHTVTLKDSAIMGDKFMGRAAEELELSAGKKPRISTKYAGPETSGIIKSVEAGKTNAFALEATK